MLPMQAQRTFTPDERSVAAARRFAREALATWGATELTETVVLLVSELVTNAVVHAGTPVRLELRLDAQNLRVEAEDLYGSRPLPMAAERPPDDFEHGRGLLITATLASSWGVEYSGAAKRVWLSIERDTGAEAPARSFAEPGGVDSHDARVAVIETSADGAVTAWSDDAVGMLGWSQEEVAGRGFLELLEPAPGERPPDPPGGSGAPYAWQGVYSMVRKDLPSVRVFASHVARPPGGTTILQVPLDRRELLEHPRPTPGHGPLETNGLGLQDDALVRLPLDDYLALAVQRVRDGLSADAAYLLLVSDVDEYEVKAVSGLRGDLRGTRLTSDAKGTPDSRNPHLPVIVSDLAETPIKMLADTALRSLVVVSVAIGGQVVGALAVGSERVDGFDHEEAVRLQRLANTLAVATERARLKAAERDRRGWLTFLAEAGDLLAGSLDADMTMAITGQIVVPQLALWCAVHLDDDRGRPVLQQAWHEDERLTGPLRTALAATTLNHVVEPAEPVLQGSVLNIGLRARGRRIGVLTLGRADGDPLRGEALMVAESVARRAALAIDNARAHGDLKAIGNALQQSLLPSSTPSAPGLDIGVVYEAAGEGSTAGGDFYDLFAIGGGRWCFAVGDVCGTGPEAAAVTGLARHTIRALALAGFPTPAVLERLNTAILEEGARARFLTLLCGTLDAEAGGVRLRMVSAGHPLPFLVRVGGTVEQVGRPQSLLGVIEHETYVETQHLLGRGDRLVAMTDGVLERRDGARMLGEERVVAELAHTDGLSAQSIAAAVRRLVVDFAEDPPRDDMAVLVIGVGETALPPTEDSRARSEAAVAER